MQRHIPMRDMTLQIPRSYATVDPISLSKFYQRVRAPNEKSEAAAAASKLPIRYKALKEEEPLNHILNMEKGIILYPCSIDVDGVWAGQ